MSYDTDHASWSIFDRAQSAASLLRFMLSMHAAKDDIRAAMGPNNYACAFEYLDCVDKNLPVLQQHIRDLILLAERLSSRSLEPWDIALIARAREDAGLADPDLVHEVIIGLGGEGFRATCTCGWRSSESWSREVIAVAASEHRRRARLESAE